MDPIEPKLSRFVDPLIATLGVESESGWYVNVRYPKNLSLAPFILAGDRCSVRAYNRCTDERRSQFAWAIDTRP